MAVSVASENGIDLVNEVFLRDFPADAARAIDELRRNEAVKFVSRQPAEIIVHVWPYLTPARGDEILEGLTDDVAAKVLEGLDPGICASTLRRASDSEREHLLGLMSEAAAKEIERFMSYPDGSAGRVMDGRFITFRAEQTAGSALETLRKRVPKGLRQLILVDDALRLDSIVDIQDLAMADPEMPLGTIAKAPPAITSPFDSREEVAEKLRDLNIEMLPVVDVNGRLIGVIRYAALLRTLREETSADIQTMVGVGKEERALSSPFLAVRKRLPWMEVNLATAFLAAAVVGLFENTIAMFTALAVLLPVVAGQSGNAGAQALAVTMRGLALREITGRHSMKVMLKEAAVGLLNGVAIALTTGLGVLIWSRSPGLAFVISVAMVISMVAAGIAGALIPIGLTRVGQDPAQSSSIILTTVTDVAGFMSFLGIATLLSELL